MGIKAVEMVRAIRDQHYEETKLMNTEEYLAYLNAKAGKLKNKQVVSPSSGLRAALT